MIFLQISKGQNGWLEITFQKTSKQKHWQSFTWLATTDASKLKAKTDIMREISYGNTSSGEADFFRDSDLLFLPIRFKNYTHAIKSGLRNFTTLNFRMT